MIQPQAHLPSDPIDPAFPCWEDYADGLATLASLRGGDAAALPSAAQLQSLLSPAVTNQRGQPIQCVSPSTLPEGNYEEHIFNTGKVSTRHNWHDVFNALVWSRFPKIKAAMNALHVKEMHKQPESGRGRLRDALTLWDECGVIIASAYRPLLEDLAQRRWQDAFRAQSRVWGNEASVFVCGHALLEKFLQPYKSNTANALLVQISSDLAHADRAPRRQRLDSLLAQKLVKGELIATSADLSPLPLAGIPGWWAGGAQDDEFYADDWVFRKPPASFRPVKIVNLTNCEYG